nr:pentapeptide repeat-containing protein [Rhodoferax sp.]
MNYEKTSLAGAKFTNVDLGSSHFEDVSLRAAKFTNVALNGAHFSDANFSNVLIEDSNLEGMTINGILVTELLMAYGRNSGGVE